MSNIMLCIEKLEIGGAETALITQAFALKRKGHKVIILAQNGIYTDLLREKDIEVIDFEFIPTNGIDFEKTREVINIIDNFNIQEVHIHKFFCIQSVWLACIIKNIPYISYNHTLTDEDYTWFKNKYPFYKYFLNTYYLNAAKIIVVTERSLENSLRRFPKIPLEKYTMLPNCIDFEEYKTSTEVRKINKFLIISRLAEGKLVSIKNGIDLFVKYVEISKEYGLQLDIVGDGPSNKKILEYINNENNKKYNINMLGEINNVSKIMDKYDVVIGIGRCILEALALKKIAILSGIEKMKGIITPKNIDRAMKCNFAGRLLKDIKIQKVATQIYNLKNNEIKEMIESNYNFIRANLDINDKVIFLENNKVKYSHINLIEEILMIQNNLLEELSSTKTISDEIWNQKQYLANENKMLKEENKQLKKIVNKK